MKGRQESAVGINKTSYLAGAVIKADRHANREDVPAATRS
jgi:hypothetical protein